MSDYIGKYKIIRELGSGSMGIVFLVEDEEKQALFALKKMKPIHFLDGFKINRFENEAQLISQLNHPNIVKVLDFGKESGIPFLVMEYMDGGSLSDLLTFGVMGIPHAVYLISTIMEGLKYAHSVGIRHADLKTSNILLKKDGQVKITDFGLATIVVTSDRMGTPAYMAPELITNDKVDQRADIYSLGVILYEITTGKLPFQGKTAYEVLQKHLKESPLPPSSIIPNYPRELEDIICKTLKKDPEERYSSVKEMMTDFNKLPTNMKSPGSSFGIELSLKTFPEKAEIYYDNIYRGLTPVKLLDLLPGEGSLLIKKYGYQDIIQKFNFKSPASINLNYRLKSYNLPLYEIDLGNIPACNFCLMDNSLLVGARHGELIEVDLDTGSIISSIFIGGEFTKSVTCIDGFVVLSFKDGRIAFLRTSNIPPYLKGSSIYKLFNPGETIAGEILSNYSRVYFGTDNGSLYCLKSSSGERVFKRVYDIPLKEIHLFPQNDIIYLSFYNGLFKALDSLLGEEIWTLETTSSYYLTPIFHEGKVLLVSKEGIIYYLSAKDGKIIFRHYLNKQVKSIVALDENNIYLYTSNGTLISANIIRQQFLWETRMASKNSLTTSVCYPGHIVDQVLNLILGSGLWIKIDKVNGRVLFEHDFGAAVNTKPIEKNGIYYLIDDSGKLYAIPLT